MSGGRDKKDNVYPLGNGTSLDDLVRHMRQVRDSVPVNRRLRRELRAKLIEGRQDNAERPADHTPERAPAGVGRGVWRPASGLILAFSLLAALVMLMAGEPGEKVLEAGLVSEMARFWAQDDPLTPAVSPPAGLITVERGGALLLLNREGSRFAAVRPAAGLKYSSPAWSPDGRKLALVRHTGNGSDLIVLEIPPETWSGDAQRVIEEGIEGAAVLARQPAGISVAGLAWSPDGGTVAYSLREKGQARLFLAGAGRDPVSLGPGANPAWSPDGKWLVVEREGRDDKTLWLVDKEGKRSHLLGSGRFPVWSKDGYLFFVKTVIKEKILSFFPDGSPQFTVQRKTGEIRWIKTGKGEEAVKTLSSPAGRLAGARLLLAPDSPSGPEEMQWLKSLELAGVRGPRTLFLDRIGEVEGLAAGDLRSLLLVRRDGGTVVLIRVALMEKAAIREGSEK